MSTITAKYHLSLGDADTILSDALKDSSKKTNLTVYLEKFAKNMKKYPSLYATELSSEYSNNEKLDDLASKWKKLDPAGFLKYKVVFDLVINKSKKITQACISHQVSIKEYSKFIGKYDGNVNKQSKKSHKTPMMEAIDNGDPKTVELLLELGCNPSKYDEEGETPLNYAVKNNNPEIVKILVKHGANVNGADGYDCLPIDYAIEKENAPMLELLKSLGADLNFSDGLEITPLLNAITDGNVKGVKLLLDAGADMELCDEENQTPLGYAMATNQKEIARFLESRGADKEYARNYINIKYLGAVFGIDGSTRLTDNIGRKKTIALEGLQQDYTVQMLNKYIQFFFTSPEFSALQISDKSKKQIVSSFSSCYSNTSGVSKSSIISKIEKNKPIVVLGGTKNHAIISVFYKDKLIVCNRGEGKRETAIMIYLLPPHRLTTDVLEKMGTKYQSTAEFNEMVEQLNLWRIGGYQLKEQKVGNCSWASLKAAFMALCCATTDDSIGKKIYKTFTRFARKKAFEDYLISSYSKEDPTLLKRLVEKAGKKGLYPEKVLRLYGSIAA